MRIRMARDSWDWTKNVCQVGSASRHSATRSASSGAPSRMTYGRSGRLRPSRAACTSLGEAGVAPSAGRWVPVNLSKRPTRSIYGLCGHWSEEHPEESIVERRSSAGCVKYEWSLCGNAAVLSLLVRACGFIPRFPVTVRRLRRLDSNAVGCTTVRVPREYGYSVTAVTGMGVRYPVKVSGDNWADSKPSWSFGRLSFR